MTRLSRSLLIAPLLAMSLTACVGGDDKSDKESTGVQQGTMADVDVDAQWVAAAVGGNSLLSNVFASVAGAFAFYADPAALGGGRVLREE